MYNIQLETNFVFNVLRDCRIKKSCFPLLLLNHRSLTNYFCQKMYYVSCVVSDRQKDRTR